MPGPIAGIGVDLVEVGRIRALHEKQGDHFLDTCFTPDEVAYALRKARAHESLAARFAAKEAVMKALGTGWAEGVSFRGIEVTVAESGAPSILLHGGAAEYARERGIGTIHLSLSHTGAHAIAYAIAEYASPDP